jgi:uncharacterized RDD family membrane protein YckC
VLTPERVALQYDIAGLGSRAAALFVDGALQGLALLLLLIAFVTLFAPPRRMGPPVDAAGQPNATLWILLAIVFFVVFLVVTGYFIFFEIVWNGQTPGKRLLGIRVIRENGYPLRPRDAVVRHVVGLVDGLLTGYTVGPLVMLLNERAKRVGDFAAGTIVVRENAARTLATLADWPAAAGSPALVEGHVAAALAAGDATLVRDFLVRRDTLDAAARRRLAARLAAALSRRYGLEARRRDLSDEGFLEALAARA